MNKSLFYKRKTQPGGYSSRLRFEEFAATRDARSALDRGFWGWAFHGLKAMLGVRKSNAFEEYVHDELDKAYKGEAYIVECMMKIEAVLGGFTTQKDSYVEIIRKLRDLETGMHAPRPEPKDLTIEQLRARMQAAVTSDRDELKRLGITFGAECERLRRAVNDLTAGMETSKG